MVTGMYGGMGWRGDAIVALTDNGYKELCFIRTRKLTDALKIAQIVATSIEIDELTAPATGHNTNKQTER